METVDLDALVGRFLDRTLPKVEWTHQAHLAVGAWHVDRYGPDEALTRLRDGIRALNDSHGTINSASSGYHETITRAYVRLIAGFFADCADLPLPERVAGLIGGSLGDAMRCFATTRVRRYCRRRREPSGWSRDVHPLP